MDFGELCGEVGLETQGGDSDPNGIAAPCPAAVGIQITSQFYGIHFSQSTSKLCMFYHIGIVVFFKRQWSVMGAVKWPMENYVGNLDLIGVFHNRWTSRLSKVGTVHAMDIRGFGNPGLDREIGSG